MRRTKNKLFSIRNGLSVIVLAILVLFLFLFLKKIIKPDSGIISVEETKDISVKIAILNGCGYSGIASEVKEYFLNNHSDNIDVVGCKNVESNKFIYKQTIIVLKHDEPDKLAYIMKLVNIPRRIFAFDDNSIEDVQIILGQDYLEYFQIYLKEKNENSKRTN